MASMYACLAQGFRARRVTFPSLQSARNGLVTLSAGAIPAGSLASARIALARQKSGLFV